MYDVRFFLGEENSSIMAARGGSRFLYHFQMYYKCTASYQFSSTSRRARSPFRAYLSYIVPDLQANKCSHVLFSSFLEASFHRRLFIG